MMRFHKIDHFEILMVMSHKSFIIFELGLITSSINIQQRQELDLEGWTFHMVPYHTLTD